MRTAIGLLVVAAALVSAAPGSGAPQSGIRGTVIKSPTSPVCQEGMSCSAPAAGIVFAAFRRGVRIATATTNDAGVYRFVLKPGTYVVRSLRASMFGSLPTRTVRVVPGRFAVRNYEIDTGIR